MWCAVYAVEGGESEGEGEEEGREGREERGGGHLS